MTAPRPPAGPERDVSLFDLLTPVVRRWRIVAGTAFAVAVVAAVVLLLQQPVFTARTTFTPETPSGGTEGGLGGLVGLAGQLGINVTGGTSISPEFFVSLLYSREVASELLRSGFIDSASGVLAPRPLADHLEITGATPAERAEKGVRAVRKRVEATVDKGTGIVSLEVEMPSASLAADVANRLVALLNRFNLERRQLQSREQRRFAGERLEEARRTLREAEQAQLEFLERNRMFQQSPVLSAQAARLARQVQVQQELYLTLVKAYEEARIAEVRDTPVLTVVDSAVAPARRSRPRRTLGVLIATVLGGMAGVALAYLLEFRRRTATGRPDVAEFRAAVAAAKADAAGLFRRGTG